MKSSGRLTVTGAMRHETSFDTSVSSATTTTSSASLSRAERELKLLKAENGKLRRDLKDVRSLYDQLMMENTHEKFDERRIAMLKSLIIQLERQVLLLSDALSSRTDTLMEVENALTWLTDKFRSYISLDVKGPDVRVPRSDLTQMVHTSESARIKLYKNIENTSKEKMSKPLIFMNKFLKPSNQEQITLFDIMSGSLENINLKEVGKLESKLGKLYKELTSLHEIMEEDGGEQTEHKGHMFTSRHTCKVVQDRLNSQLLKSCALTKDCCGDLLTLSILHPSAPWPCLKKQALKDVSVDRVMRCLPGLPRGKAGEVHDVVEALLKSFNYRQHMAIQLNKSLKEEVKFHKAVYNLQISYAESLLTAIKDGYREFETSTNEVILKPLKGVLEAYSDMKKLGSEGSLKEFLTQFKNTYEQLEDAVDKLSLTDGTSEDSPGRNAVSQFGEEFFSEIDRLVRRCQYRRDKTCRERAELKAEQDKIDNELRLYLDEQESKYQDHHTQEENATSPSAGIVKQASDNATSEKLQYKGEIDLSDMNEDNASPHTNFHEGVNGRKSRHSIDKRPPWDDSVYQQSIDKSVEKQSKTSKDSTLEDRPLWDNSVDVPAETFSENNVEKETVEFHSPTGQEGNCDVLPPKGLPKNTKLKKDRNYVPNTFVPNRTLQLRRSGSLNKLNEKLESERRRSEMSVESDKDDSVQSKSRRQSQSRERDNVKSGHKVKIPTKRPFYS